MFTIRYEAPMMKRHITLDIEWKLVKRTKEELDEMMQELKRSKERLRDAANNG